MAIGPGRENCTESAPAKAHSWSVEVRRCGCGLAFCVVVRIATANRCYSRRTLDRTSCLSHCLLAVLQVQLLKWVSKMHPQLIPSLHPMCGKVSPHTLSLTITAHACRLCVCTHIQCMHMQCSLHAHPHTPWLAWLGIACMHTCSTWRPSWSVESRTRGGATRGSATTSPTSLPSA